MSGPSRSWQTHALGAAALVLVACGGEAFSTASDGDSGAAADVAGSEASQLDGPGGGPDSTVDGGPAVDGAFHDAGAHDAPFDVAALDVTPHDAVAGGCDAGADQLHVFVTSQSFTASSLGGLPGADKICQAAAAGAGMSGTYVAWLSGGGVDAIDRICATTASFVLPDGTVVAKGTAGLTSGTLLHAIDETEKGQPAPTTPTACGDTQLAVWTGTEYTGMGQTNYDCHDWTSSSVTTVNGVVGFAQASTGSWTYACSGLICNGSASLYCIEQ